MKNTDKDIKNALELHALWLNNERDGKRFALKNLSGANLTWANMTWADLT